MSKFTVDLISSQQDSELAALFKVFLLIQLL